MAKLVLGIHYAYGGSAAALLRDGEPIAAAEEALFRNKRHFALFPQKAVKFCLERAGVDGRQIQAVALSRRSTANFWDRLRLSATHPRLIGEGSLSWALPGARQELRALRITAGVKSVEHHVAHLLSVRWMAGPDPLALLSLDGLGDFVSTTMGYGDRDRLRILERVLYPNSLGLFFTAVAHYLGFPRFGDEQWVSELGRFGTPRFLEPMRRLVRERDPWGFELNREAFPLLKRPAQAFLHFGESRVKPFYRASYWAQMLGVPPRKPNEPLRQEHFDLAKSAQRRFEEIGNHLLAHLQERVGGDRLALAGGCVQNSYWVGTIPRVTRFKQVFVPPAPGNAGSALGAAMSCFRSNSHGSETEWARLGPKPDEVASLSTPHAERRFPNTDQLAKWLAREIAQGKTAAVVRGALEFGAPLAGSRVLIADPRATDLAERLIPTGPFPGPRLYRFAAATLWEKQTKYFPGSWFSRYGEAGFELAETHRTKLPALCPGDASCTVVSVKKETSPFLAALLEAFQAQTGVPLLWMSPFVEDGVAPAYRADALGLFDRTNVDFLILEDAVLEKRGAKKKAS